MIGPHRFFRDGYFEGVKRFSNRIKQHLHTIISPKFGGMQILWLYKTAQKKLAILEKIPNKGIENAGNFKTVG